MVWIIFMTHQSDGAFAFIDCIGYFISINIDMLTEKRIEICNTQHHFVTFNL